MTKPKNTPTPTPVLPIQPATLPSLPPPTMPGPEQPVGECPKCHIKLYQVMHFTCQRHDCPCFHKVTC